MLTDEGVALAARHRVWALPTLIIDDTIVAEGDVELPDLEAALGSCPAATEGRTAHRGDAERLYPAGLSQADSVNDSAAWRSCGETTNRQG